MPLNDRVLKGTVTGHKRDAVDDHYQTLVHAGAGVGLIGKRAEDCIGCSTSEASLNVCNTQP